MTSAHSYNKNKNVMKLLAGC